MVPPPVDFMEISARLVNLPTMHPRPSASNIRAFVEALIDVLCTYPSQQSEEHGYRGMVEQAEIYALTHNVPWGFWVDPGPTRRGTEANPHPDWPNNDMDADSARAEQAMWEANTKVYANQQNVKRAVIDSLNLAVPKSYRRVAGAGIGAVNYRVTEDPRDILAGLQDRYGRPTPTEKRKNETTFNSPWIHATETVEDYFGRLEDCYITAIIAKPPFTMEQMIDKAMTAITETGQYHVAILEWNGFDAENQTWPELKAHFTEAYDLLQRTGAGTARDHGYHQGNNAVDGDDDSLGSLRTSVTNIHQAHNANAHAMNDNISALTAEATSQRETIAALQQQIALLTVQPAAPPQPYYAPPPAPPVYAAQPAQPVAAYAAQPAQPVAAYAAQPPPPPAVPAYVPVNPPTYYQNNGGRGGRGRGRGCGRGRGRGRGYYNQSYTPAAAPPATSANGTIPPPPGQNTAQQDRAPNTTKYFNNWNMCCTCGWDVANWHTSQTCPYKHTNPQHNDSITRANADQYAAAGWRVSNKKRHRMTLPTNPQPKQA